MLNKVLLIGRLGATPELRYTPSGTAVVKFRLATQEKKDLPADWHNIVIFGKMAETTEKFLDKGSKVYIEGRLQTRSYEDRDGIKRYVTEVVAQKVVFLDSKNNAPSPENKEENYINKDEDYPMPDDDFLPF